MRRIQIHLDDRRQRGSAVAGLIGVYEGSPHESESIDEVVYGR